MPFVQTSCRVRSFLGGDWLTLALLALFVLAALRIFAQEPPAASPVPPPAPDEQRAPAEPGEMNEDGTDEPILLEATVKEMFTPLELRTNDWGYPLPQTIRLNEKVIEENGWRYSGFWFVVDRTEAAKKQGFRYWKTKMAMYSYLLSSKAMRRWALNPVGGPASGPGKYRPLKLGRFKHLRDVPPKDKDWLIIETEAARDLQEGKTYYMQFAFPADYKEPSDLTICMGYREAIWNYNRWEGFNTAIKFLGLEHWGKVTYADMVQLKKKP